MHILPSKDKQKGQVLLLVVLASVIALTVGLAAISRSVTNTRISTEEANSQRALAAAEAGVEEQINAINKIIEEGGTIQDLTQDFESSIFNSEAIEINDEDFELEDGALISQDDGADVWIAPYPGLTAPNPPQPQAANINVFWKGSNCDGNEAAIEIVVIENIGGSLGMNRYATDACSRPNGIDYETPRPSIPQKYSDLGYNRSFAFSTTQGYIARIIPLYAGANIAIQETSAVDLPTQGYRIESTGESGDSVRKLRVYQGFPKLPVEFFPYNLFLP